MKQSKFSEEQIVYAIWQAESGTPVGDLCWQLGVGNATFHASKNSATLVKNCLGTGLTSVPEDSPFGLSTLQGSLRVHDTLVGAMYFSPDGRYIATASDDKPVWI